MPSEKDIETFLKRKVKEIGGLCLKFTSPSSAGVPDRIILYKGKALFVELKAPGKKPRALQDYWQKEIRKRGIGCLVIDSKEAADQLIEKIRSGGQICQEEGQEK